MDLKSSGSEESFGTGAVRDTSDDKSCLELISPFFEKRLGDWLSKGAVRYQRRNWEKGIPIERCLGSLMRHLNAYRAGKTDEDHISAVACNVMFIIHNEEMIKRGVMPEEIAFNPDYGEE